MRVVPVVTGGDSWASLDTTAPTQAQAGVLASELIAVARGMGTTGWKAAGCPTDLCSNPVLLSWQVV